MSVITLKNIGGASGGSGASTFIDLTDTDPTGYAGNAGKAIIGNDAEIGLTFGQAIRTTDSPTFAGIIISAVTSGNVLSSNGTTFVGVTPDSAGLVTKAGTQTISGAKTFSEHVVISTGREFRLYDADDSNYVGFVAGSLSANKVWTLPTADGSNGQALVTNGSAVLSFATITANAGGSDTQVQFNDGGTALGGDAGLTYNKTTNVLTITSGALVTPKIYPASDSTTAVQILKADGTTSVLNVDTTNSRVGIGIVPDESLQINGDIHLSNTRTRTMTREVPTTVGHAVDIGTFTLTHGAGNFEFWINIQSNGYAQSKKYFIPVTYNGTSSAWRKVLPISSTGPYVSQDMNLEINSTLENTSFRLRRISGTTAGTAYITILQQGVDTDIFVASTTSGLVTAPTLEYLTFGEGIVINKILAGTGARLFTSSASNIADILNAFSPTELSTTNITPETCVRMIRAGTSGNKYNATVDFNIGSYVASLNSQTRLDIKLGNGAVNNTDTIVLTMQGNGNVGIGTTSPSTRLHTVLENSTTAAVDNVVTIGHNSTGTPAAGFGAGLLFTLESSTTADQSAARFAVAWKVSTHAIRTVTSKWLASDFNGEREGICVESDGTQALIGFLGANAIARQSHIVDADGTLADITTKFNTLLAYLENFGFIAPS